ncbi:dockerin type I domain-containing protein [Roseiconus nitratireducens]|nr:dockerin type I domain-containing protein [Roseiconus nitratireducens]
MNRSRPQSFRWTDLVRTKIGDAVARVQRCGSDPAFRGGEFRSCRRLQVEALERRQLMAADLPLGATPLDTGEFLLGSVTVTPVFFESDGSIDPNTQDWTANEIDQTLDKIRASTDWWVNLLAKKTSVHQLAFEIDETFARTPVSTGYEPIDRSSITFERYVGDWLTDLGYGDAPSIERAVQLFNDTQREKFQTDWAFTIFVADSSDDADGFFAAGGFTGAFAYPGGLFYVVPSGRPVSTYSHEMGHIFWARDEYPGAGSYNDQRGYYNAQNLNAYDDAPAGHVQEDSIMRGNSVADRAYAALDSPDSTLAMIGWRDSDGDGIFDVLDVPLSMDAIGYFDPLTSVYSIRGAGSVETLANQNSSGPQSDITLSRIKALEYQLDGGTWQTAAEFDATAVEFDLDVSITEPFDSIGWRVTDTRTGITSVPLESTRQSHLFSGLGGGVAFVDQNANGLLDAGERLLEGSQVTLQHADGSELFRAQAVAASLADGETGSIGTLSLSGVGLTLDGRVAVGSSTTRPDVRVFQVYDDQSSSWRDRISGERRLQVESSQSTGRVAIDFLALDTGSYGLEDGSYARVEAFDSDGNRLSRITSPQVPAGEAGQLIVEDPRGQIASVVIYGHAETDILVTAVAFGTESTQSVDRSGGWVTEGIADGNYQVRLTSPNLIYQFTDSFYDLDVTNGSASPVLAAAKRVDSPRHHGQSPGDVNADQIISPQDALLVINDLARFGSRLLSPDEAVGDFVDVNNDGYVSAIDALRVINLLERNQEGEGEQATGQRADDPGAGPALTESQLSTGASASPSPDHSPTDFLPPPPPFLADSRANSVDQVFRELEPEWVRTDSFTDRENPKMLNSAGQPPYGESRAVGPVDSREEAKVFSQPIEIRSALADSPRFDEFPVGIHRTPPLDELF